MTGGGRLRTRAAIHLLLSGLWAGGLAFFAGAAGVVLRTAPSRADGGVINRALLDLLDVASLATAGTLVVLLVSWNRVRPWGKTARGLSLRLLAVAAVAAFVSLYLITPEMVALRAKAGPLFDSLPAADPLRRAWGRLHGLSSLMLLLRFLAAVAVFALGFREATAEETVRKPAQEPPPPPEGAA